MFCCFLMICLCFCCIRCGSLGKLLNIIINVVNLTLTGQMQHMLRMHDNINTDSVHQPRTLHPIAPLIRVQIRIFVATLRLLNRIRQSLEQKSD